LAASKLHSEEISDADLKHPVIRSNTTALNFTDDALCGEKVGVDIQVLLIFRHENFTARPFTAW
jgi:hypothetical protein